MTKRDNDLRARLRTAALELFHERGYDQTTAAEIAALAGVTERTFFRRFPDKREVLFDAQDEVRATLTDAIADSPADLGTLKTLVRAFQALQPILEDKRSYAKPRHDIIAATPALQERELAKIAALTSALAAALHARGVPAFRATLAAQAGMAAFAHASSAWLDDPAVELGARIDLAFREMRTLFAEGN